MSSGIQIISKIDNNTFEVKERNSSQIFRICFQEEVVTMSISWNSHWWICKAEDFTGTAMTNAKKFAHTTCKNVPQKMIDWIKENS